MLKKKSVIIFFIILFIFIVVSVTFYKLENRIGNNGQRVELEKKIKEENIGVRLDSALMSIEKDNQKAQELSKYCLSESKKLKNKSLEMRSYFVLGRVNSDSIKQSQIHYNKALLISEEINDNWYRGEILYRKAISQYRLNDTKLALETLNEALYFCQLSNNYKTIGSTYSMIGTIFRVNGVYSRAIEYFIKARLNYNKTDFSEGDAWVTYLLGQVHSDLRDSEKAMQYFQESLNKYQVLASIDGDRSGLAICHEQIAILNLQFGNFEEASKNINILLEIHTEINSKYGVSNAYSLLGKLQYLKGNCIEAEAYLNKSLQIKNTYLSLHGKATVYEFLGLCQIQTGNFVEGIETIKQGLEIALSTNSKKNQLEIYSKLADIYLKENNLEEAIFYEKKQIEVQNFILYGEADIKIEQLQTFYEIEEKNRQINELKKENEVNVLQIKQQRIYQFLMVLIILIVIFVAGSIYVFYNKLRQKNKELKILNTTTNKLFSIIAHDLRSPFNTILGFSDLISNNAEELETSEIVKFGGLINTATANTLALLENLLAWAKSQTGQMSYKPVKINLQPIIEKTIDVLKPSADFKSIALKQFNLVDVEVFADQDMLNTILRNLITNAIKFTQTGGVVTITAFQKNCYIEIEVSDNGVGLDSEIINNLFTQQTNHTTLGTSNEKGSGLGLVLCKELVEKHGGTIWVVSEPNKGAAFHFTLPNCPK